MATGIPREPTRKHRALSYERDELRARLSQVEDEIVALGRAIAIFDSERKQPATPRMPRSPNRWPNGKLTSTWLRLLCHKPGGSSLPIPPVSPCRGNNQPAQRCLVAAWPRNVSHHGSGNARRPADAPLRVSVVDAHPCNSFSTAPRAQNFPPASSCRMILSTVRSATAFFGRAFSAASFGILLA